MFSQEREELDAEWHAQFDYIHELEMEHRDLGQEAWDAYEDQLAAVQALDDMEARGGPLFTRAGPPLDHTDDLPF